MNRTVAVVFGGASNENEISIITGTMAANVLKSGGDEVVPVYIAQSGAMYTGEWLTDINNFKDGAFARFPRAAVVRGGVCELKKNGKSKKFRKVDVALNCCHGGLGEGGGVCGLFALNDIPLAGAGMFESAAFMDKYFTKIVLASLGVNALPYAYLRASDDIGAAEKLGYPLIVKPAKLGSSIGVARADNRSELAEALKTAFIFDDGVIAEEYVENRREINCAAYYSAGSVITGECEEAVSANDILSFDDKYTGGAKSVLPADIPKEISDGIKRITADVYSRLNMRGIVRFDYILRGDEIILSEINTVPGSLAYYLLCGGFGEFYPVLQAVMVQAEEDYKSCGEKRLLHTGILDNLPENGCKYAGK